MTGSVGATSNGTFPKANQSSQLDFAPELTRFVCVASYKDLAPTEPLLSPAAAGPELS
jgi:hypothetical protein